MKNLRIIFLSAWTCLVAQAEVTSDQPNIFGDDTLQISVSIKDDSTSIVHHGMNRTYVEIELKNISSLPIVPKDTFTVQWTVDAQNPEDGVPNALDKDGADKIYPGVLTAWGTMMEHAMRHHWKDPDLAPGEIRKSQFDLGRMYDLTLSRRYFLAGSLTYLVDNMDKSIAIKRYQISK